MDSRFNSKPSILSEFSKRSKTRVWHSDTMILRSNWRQLLDDESMRCASQRRPFSNTTHAVFGRRCSCVLRKHVANLVNSSLSRSQRGNGCVMLNWKRVANDSGINSRSWFCPRTGNRLIIFISVTHHLKVLKGNLKLSIVPIIFQISIFLIFILLNTDLKIFFYAHTIKYKCTVSNGTRHGTKYLSL